ncbi:MAG: hypothetical protein V1797_10405 [Pseudomonadota bacterium]
MPFTHFKNDMLWMVDWWAIPIGHCLIMSALPVGFGTYLIASRISAWLASGFLNKYQVSAMLAVCVICIWRMMKCHYCKGGATIKPSLQILSVNIESNKLKFISESLPLLSIVLWIVWIIWVAFWWNRSFYPYDHGREATIAYMWIHGIRPYVDHYLAHHTLGGVSFYYVVIKLFGFTPFIWRLLFIAIFGLIAWLIFLLLSKLVAKVNALCTVVVLCFFVHSMYITGYLQYYWLGMLLMLLSTVFFLKAFTETNTQLIYALLGSLAIAINLFTIPQFAMTSIISLISYVIVCWFAKIKRDLLWPMLWITFTSLILFTAAILTAMNFVGILNGYLRWLTTIPSATTDLYNLGSVGQAISNWTFPVSLTKGSYFSEYSWPAVLFLSSYLLGIKCRLFQDKKFRMLSSISYWIIAISLCAWVIAVPRIALEKIDEYVDLIKIIPASSIIFAIVMVACIVWELIYAGKKQKEIACTWLYILIAGLGAYFSVIWNHRSVTYALSMSIILTPVTWSWVLFKMTQYYGTSLPKGLAVLLSVLLILVGGAHKITHFPYGTSFWDKWEYFNYPALRHMQDPGAAELDTVLFTAKKVADQGGTIIVYPRKITIYPLLGILPPQPFPDLDPTLYCYPKEKSIWLKATKAIDMSKPEMIIFDINDINVKKWESMNQDNVHIPKSIREVGDLHFLGINSPNYRTIFRGKTYILFERTSSE